MIHVANTIAVDDPWKMLLDGVRWMHEVQIRKEDKVDTPHIDSQGCPLGTHLLTTTHFDGSLPGPQQLHSVPQLYSISVPPTFPSKRLLHATQLTTICSALKGGGIVKSETT